MRENDIDSYFTRNSSARLVWLSVGLWWGHSEKMNSKEIDLEVVATSDSVGSSNRGTSYSEMIRNVCRHHENYREEVLILSAAISRGEEGSLVVDYVLNRQNWTLIRFSLVQPLLLITVTFLALLSEPSQHGLRYSFR